MLIERLQVRGLLSFGPNGIDLEMEPLNVLIGPNCSGKSNLLATLALLQATANDTVAYLDETGGHGDWLWKGPASDQAEPNWKPSISATVRLPNETATLRHDLSVMPRNGDWQIDEHIFSLNQDGKERAPSPDEISRLRQAYADIRLYRDWTLGAGVPTLRGQNTEEVDNLAQVIAGMPPSHREQLADYLRRFDDRVLDLSTPERDGQVSLVVEERTNGPMSASALSDGTLRYLSLFTILLAPNPPPLIAIEEPERGLHPDLAYEMAKLIWATSERTQLVMTTHSTMIVDEMTEHPSSVVAFDHYAGETRCRRVRSNIMSGRSDDAHSLADVWASGGIGGNRW